MFRRLAGWWLWLWHITDPRPRVDPVIDRRMKECRVALQVAEDLQHHSRAGNLRALQQAAELLDLPKYHVALDTDDFSHLERRAP